MIGERYTVITEIALKICRYETKYMDIMDDDRPFHGFLQYLETAC